MIGKPTHKSNKINVCKTTYLDCKPYFKELKTDTNIGMFESNYLIMVLPFIWLHPVVK